MGTKGFAFGFSFCFAVCCAFLALKNLDDFLIINCICRLANYINRLVARIKRLLIAFSVDDCIHRLFNDITGQVMAFSG